MDVFVRRDVVGALKVDGINILFALENEFNIYIPDEDVKTIRSVRDVVEGVRKLVERGGGVSGNAAPAAS